MDHSKDELLMEEWDDGNTGENNIDGTVQYAMGFWFRYLTSFPKRLVRKPAWLQLARFSSNKETEDAKNIGDRTLAVFLSGQGNYHFATYNMRGPKLSTAQDIAYDSSLEGIWTFVYFGFDQFKQSAAAFVLFSEAEPRLERVLQDGLRHRPLD
jgi:hypothetical protein